MKTATKIYYVGSMVIWAGIIFVGMRPDAETLLFSVLAWLMIAYTFHKALVLIDENAEREAKIISAIEETIEKHVTTNEELDKIWGVSITTLYRITTKKRGKNNQKHTPQFQIERLEIPQSPAKLHMTPEPELSQLKLGE